MPIFLENFPVQSNRIFCPCTILQLKVLSFVRMRFSRPPFSFFFTSKPCYRLDRVLFFVFLNNPWGFIVKATPFSFRFGAVSWIIRWPFVFCDFQPEYSDPRREDRVSAPRSAPTQPSLLPLLPATHQRPLPHFAG